MQTRPLKFSNPFRVEHHCVHVNKLKTPVSSMSDLLLELAFLFNLCKSVNSFRLRTGNLGRLRPVLGHCTTSPRLEGEGKKETRDVYSVQLSAICVRGFV